MPGCFKYGKKSEDLWGSGQKRIAMYVIAHRVRAYKMYSAYKTADELEGGD